VVAAVARSADTVVAQVLMLLEQHNTLQLLLSCHEQRWHLALCMLLLLLQAQETLYLLLLLLLLLLLRQ
jgi:hypothetical protein